MKQKTVKQIERYLLSHEFDISIGENDFDSLRGVFLDLIGRKPEEPSRHLVYRYGQHPSNVE